MNAGIISTSLSALPLIRSSSGIVLMGAGVYIPNMTAETARQWVQVLTQITDEEEPGNAPKSPESSGISIE